MIRPLLLCLALAQPLSAQAVPPSLPRSTPDGTEAGP
jgi:hypothetical protein